VQIVISTAGTALNDPDNCRAFSVVVPATVSADQLPDLVAAAGIGELDPDGNHVRVDVQAVRAMAAGRVSPDWDGDFTAMLTYARSKGWLDASGSRVRAHIQRAES
jgi:hypothetical protein